MPYVPPNIRNQGLTPKKLPCIVPKEKYINKQELFETVRLENFGKADGAWSRQNGSK